LPAICISSREVADNRYQAGDRVHAEADAEDRHAPARIEQEGEVGEFRKPIVDADLFGI
jgi:hypothetical protein